MLHLDLFSGIGGFALAADRIYGKNTKHIFVENDPFCQAVLKKHWPNSKIYGDIRTFTYASFYDDRGNAGELSQADERQEKERQKERTTKFGGSDFQRPFILTGGFPCQPFSQAGRRKGTADDRFLWPEMLRVIQEFQPTWVIAENVRGILTIEQGVVFQQVCADLEASGHEVQPLIVPAVAVNAPHRRDRVWFIAHRTNDGRSCRRSLERSGQDSDDEEWSSATDKPFRERRERKFGEIDAIAPDSRQQHGGEGRVKKQTENPQKRTTTANKTERHARPNWDENWLEVATRLCRVDARVSTRVDRLGKIRNSRNERLKALGNSIVPQVAIEIMKAIRAAGLARKEI